MEKEIAVSVRDLYKIFGKFHAVDGISFDVPKGSIFGFLGPNGAGKSTTIKMLCGLLTPTSGTGRVGGLDVSRESDAIKRRIGYMSQRFSLYDDLTVEENVVFFGSLYGLTGAHLSERVEYALRLADLLERRGDMTSTLPGGIKQRLALGCAVLHSPEFLFLDEPTSGVDPISRRNFWNIIHEFANSGITVFVTTHYMEEAEYCDYLVLIYKGKIVIQGTPYELKTAKDIHNIFAARTNSLAGLYSLLSSRGEFSEVNLFGDAIHFVSEMDGGRVKDAVASLAAGAGIDLESVEGILPSLEDIFVMAISRADAAGENGNGANGAKRQAVKKA